jgi:hypothetical protein
MSAPATTSTGFSWGNLFNTGLQVIADDRAAKRERELIRLGYSGNGANPPVYKQPGLSSDGTPATPAPVTGPAVVPSIIPGVPNQTALILGAALLGLGLVVALRR